MLRATEDDDVFFLFVGGQVDHATIVAERAELERVLKLGTGRSDIELGRIRSITEYRCVISLSFVCREFMDRWQASCAHGGNIPQRSSLRCRRYAFD